MDWRVQHWRALFLRHRILAMVMIMAALCMKVAVPAGFMVAADSAVISVQICADAGGGQTLQRMAIPLRDDDGGSHGQPGAADCPYTAVAMAGLAAADAVLLAAALLYIVLAGFAPAPATGPRALAHLRPPLRGPPALI